MMQVCPRGHHIELMCCLGHAPLATLCSVDNLENVSLLSEYINESLVVVVFVSKGYFRSKNCLVELINALALHKRRELDPRKSSSGRVLPPPSILLVRESESERLENSMSPAQLREELDMAATGNESSPFERAKEQALQFARARLAKGQAIKTKAKRSLERDIIAYVEGMTVETVKELMHESGHFWRAVRVLAPHGSRGIGVTRVAWLVI